MLLSFLSSLKALQYKYCRPVHYIGSFKHFKSFSSSSKLQNFLLQEGGDIVHLKIVDSFKADIKYAFAYGSSVFKQQPTDPSDLFETTAQSVLLDFIFVVDDTAQFHAVTTKQFPHHYNPFMIQCDHFFANNSGRFLSFITDSIGARIYYNAYAELPLLPVINSLFENIQFSCLLAI